MTALAQPPGEKKASYRYITIYLYICRSFFFFYNDSRSQSLWAPRVRPAHAVGASIHILQMGLGLMDHVYEATLARLCDWTVSVLEVWSRKR